MTTRERVYEFVRTFTADNGRNPKMKEICDAVGLSSTGSVQAHLRALKAEGRLPLSGPTS